MELSGKQKIQYEKSQIVEVICQLRFPTILSIGSRDPVDFQELVRQNLPRYVQKTEKQGEQSVKTHSFLSAGGEYKLSLTTAFIALSTRRYTNWRDFAGCLDEPLGHFISVYRPAYFERIGLRYINGISRENLGLEDVRWSELVAPQYLGVLALSDTDEKQVSKASADTEMKLGDRCFLRVHAGPGLLKRTVSGPEGVREIQEKTPRFIFDQDIYASGNIPLHSAAEVLDTLHAHADRIFAGAITDKLHDAMEPVYID